MSFSLVNVSTFGALIVFSIFVNKLIYGYSPDTHNVAKRMDLESCIGRFDVQHDMIIRTEESRAMGARFLDHADLGSQEECLRLCCETDECDVFVFEEKNQGTCFLFHCGPSQNFRCKFTHHGNYTSAVLTPETKRDEVAKSVNTYPAQIVPVPLSQHEMELSNLKDKPHSDAVTTLIPPLGIRMGDITSTTKAPIIKCSRFQFQCHSGECIAIYNACDGIPQCMDGSDEGSECPANSIVAVKTQPVVPIGSQMHNNNNNNNIIQQRTNIVDVQKHQNPVPAVQRPYAMGRNREDPMTAPIKWPQQEQPFDVEQDSHIFNHKGGLQIPNTNNNNLAQQYIANNGYAVPQSEPYMQNLPDTYRIPQWSADTRISQTWPQQQPQVPMIVQPIQQQQQQLQPMQQDILESQIREQQQRSNWPVRPVVNAPLDNHPVNNNAVKLPKSKVSADNVQDSDEESEYEEDERTVQVTEPPPKKKPRKHKENRSKINKDKAKKHDEQHDKPMHEQLKMIKSDLDMEFIDHDGAADRPGGAVLSLTLGIIITAALAVLVGCRATVVRRRTRRGGKSQYAHDADFLVNGMYL
ncbi:uncharacterized protein LOC119075630 [Bradysia coprophila]|uniref:uncharacterized protein LOC119075630 n=1 Tax=Bradysia coprophila TaxID=38358 RepID=UPI00187DB7AA|nr:uncharacterized protein LOC119075630 [Bradysia coprophila]